MVNEVAIVLLWGLVGPQLTIAYVVAGLVVAVFAGLLIGRLGLERYVEDYVWKIRAGSSRRRLQADAGGPRRATPGAPRSTSSGGSGPT